MRRACLPFSWQSLHAAVALSDRLVLTVSWLSCDCCSSCACGKRVGATASISVQLCDTGEGSQPSCPRSPYSRMPALHQSLLACLLERVRSPELPSLRTGHNSHQHGAPSAPV